MRKLIVNADDYGLTAAVSVGIRQAHREGIVTSTTVMMNMPDVEAELPKALADCPGLGLGVHLVLTAGSPLLPPQQVASITRVSGGKNFPKLAAFVTSAEGLKAAEVKAEWRAQIEEFVRVAGRPPTHLDSHHHTSYLTPALFGAMLELAREYGCAIRRPLSTTANVTDILGGLPPGSDLPERVQHFLPPMLLASTDVRRPDDFEQRFYGERATLATLDEMIGRLPEGVTELMCHPGIPDEQLSAISSYTRQRAVELEVLTNHRVRERLDAAGVRLASFSAIQ